MLRQHDAGLHHVQIVHLREVDRARARSASKSACFWLSPSRQTRSPGLHDGFHQTRRVVRLDDLATGQPGAGLEAGIARFALMLPRRYRPAVRFGVSGHQHME